MKVSTELRGGRVVRSVLEEVKCEINVEFGENISSLSLRYVPTALLRREADGSVDICHLKHTQTPATLLLLLLPLLLHVTHCRPQSAHLF